MPALEIPPPFAAGVPLSAEADVETLRLAAIRLDGLAYRREALVDSMASNPSYDAHPSGDFILGRFSLRWQTGMTTLTITGTASGYTGGLTVNINGVSAGSVTMGATWTKTISIASGYADGDIVLIDILTSGNTVKTSKLVVWDVYATPVSLSGWPGVPTFAGVYSVAKLGQLADAATWLYNRLNLVPMVPTLAHYFRNGRNDLGNSGSGAGIITQYTGTVLNANTNDILRIEGWANILTNLTERIKVYLAGSLAYTGPTWTPGGYGFSIPISLSGVSAGARAEVRVQSEVLSVANNTGQDSRYSFTTLRSEAGGAGYAVQTPPVESPALTNISATTLNSRLNAIATMLANTKTTIEASNALTRYRAVRRIYGYDAHDWAKFTRSHPYVADRRGDKLVFQGKNVSIGWGAIVMETDDDGHATYKYKFANEESLTSTNKVETKEIFLDQFKGLFEGERYHVFGDVSYCAEYLS